MINLPHRVTNLTSGMQYLDVTEFTVSVSMSAVSSSLILGLSKLSLDDVFMQDTLRVEVDTRFGRVALCTGVMNGVKGLTVNGGTVGAAGITSVMTDSHVEPRAEGQKARVSEIIEGVCYGEFQIPVVFAETDMEGGSEDVMMECPSDMGTVAFGLLMDAARRAGWLLMEDGAGRLMVMRPSVERYVTALVRGLNFVDGTISMEDRRIGTVRGLAVVKGRDRRGRRTVGDLSYCAEMTDRGARSGTKQYFRSRAATSQQELENELVRRHNESLASAMTYRCEVQGFTDGVGKLWLPNRRVTVTDPLARLAAVEFIVQGVEYIQRADDNQKAILSLVPPALYYCQGPDAYQKMMGHSVVAGVGWWRDA